MSWSRRAIIGLPALVALASCGFTPAFAPGAPATALRGGIVADTPTDRLGFRFVARIEDRLGRADSPEFALGYRIDIEETAVGRAPDNTINRYTVTGTLAWSLRPATGGDPVQSGTLTSFTAYSATGTTVATSTARRDAEDRLMTILADQLVTELALRLGSAAP